MTLKLTFSNSFAALGESFYSRTQPRALDNPQLVVCDAHWLAQLGLCKASDKELAETFGGLKLPEGCDPLSMVYSGHQFGSYNPQLGDGRGILLGEVKSNENQWDIHLKGAGKTPWSRFGDGYAVLRSCIREYLASVAMRGLNIPTTHALCIVRGDNPVQREEIEPAAILTRIASTHIRFGHFEFFHYNQRFDELKLLADFVIARFLPGEKNKEGRYNALLQFVIEKTAEMIACWQSVGFAHGVMNTDNMSIMGETFDYGPYGFMENYDPTLVCNHSDTYARYAFDQQPSIGLWNLNALAFALSSLVDKDQARVSLEQYESILVKHYYSLLYKKLGWRHEYPEDKKLIATLFDIMQSSQVDYTRFFRALSFVSTPDWQDRIQRECQQKTLGLQRCLAEFSIRSRDEQKDPKIQQQEMLANNPKYILRNYLAQQAIREAYEEESFEEIAMLAKLLRSPFEEHSEFEKYAATAPDWAKNLNVSCSS